MAAVLYYGTDDRVIRALESFFKERLEVASEAHSISKVEVEEKLNEMLVAVKFDLFIIEEAVMQGRPAKDWISTFKKKYTQVEGPVLLVSGETNPLKIYQLLEAGWTDLISDPPDKPLLVEKFGLYSTGKRSSDIRQVYSMEVQSPADVARPASVISLSEFDCKIRSKHEAAVNDLATLYSEAFGEGNTRAAVVARCYATQADEANKGQHINSYYFVGISNELLTNIRKNLRKAYVSKKSS